MDLWTGSINKNVYAPDDGYDVLEHEISEHEISEHKNFEYEIFEHEISEHEISAHDNSEYESLNREISEHGISERENSEYEILDREISEHEIPVHEILENEMSEYEILEQEILKQDNIDHVYLDADYPQTEVLSFVRRVDAKLLIKNNMREYGVKLSENEFVIGRKREFSDLVLDNPAVGKTHAKLVKKGDIWYLKDMHSKNGTYLNNIKLNFGGEKMLDNSDQITVANVDMLFLLSIIDAAV